MDAAGGDRARVRSRHDEELEGPLEDARAVLREPVGLAPSLLDDAELGTDEAASETEAVRADDEEVAARAAEAAVLTEPDLPRMPNSLTPETLEEYVEGAPPLVEASLHEEALLDEALLDEGEALEGFDEDLVEGELSRREEQPE